ncbi:GpE family phage tail protein [Escherichia coli]|uniref:GpE family phage tail protein n=1 Tax=Escherichia coli TaxID=562 RepID=UPI00159346E3|nr:GpE family phage tail protein [Escherichia coli]NVD93565.1 GpE family phage tail protein [Escherichia coli]NVF71957.1 GpE family phage tail protein [Escherichia coli]
MADIATIFHWPPSVTDVMPLPVMPVRWRCVIVLQVPEPPPRLQGWQWAHQ